MGASDPKLSIIIEGDSKSAEDSLVKVTDEFNALTDTLKKPLGEIKSFIDLKNKTEKTGAALNLARQEVERLSEEMQRSESPPKALAKSFKTAQDSAKWLEQSLTAQRVELARLGQSLHASGVDTSKLFSEQMRLKRGLEDTAKAFTAEKHAMEEAAAAKKTIGDARNILGVKSFGEIEAEIVKVKNAYKTLKDSGSASLSELAQAKLKVLEKTRELENQTNGWAASLDKAKVGIAGLAGATAGWALSVNAAKDFEAAMADVAKVVEAPEEKIASLSETILGLTRTIPMTAVELAKIAEAGGQMGIAADQIEEFVTVTAKIAIAFKMTAEQAGETFGKLRDLWKMSVSEVSTLSDTINVLGNEFNTTEAKISEVLVRIGTMPKMFGLSAREAAALSAAVLSLGKSPEVAATGINALLSRLQTANAQTPEFRDALAGIGLSARQLATDINEHPQQALWKFLETLSLLDNKARAEVLTKLFGQEHQDDVAAVVDGLDLYKRTLSSAMDDTKAFGSVNKEFERGMKTLKNQLQVAKNAVNELGIVIGTGAIPAVKQIVGAGAGVAHTLTALASINPVLTDIVLLIGTVAASFGTLTLLGRTASLALSKVFEPVVTSLTAARTSLTSFVTVVEGGVPKLNALRMALVGVSGAAAAFGAERIVEFLRVWGEAQRLQKDLAELGQGYHKAGEEFEKYAYLKKKTTEELTAMDAAALQAEADNIQKATKYWMNRVNELTIISQQWGEAGREAALDLVAAQNHLQGSLNDLTEVGATARSAGVQLMTLGESAAKAADSAGSATRMLKEQTDKAIDSMRIGMVDLGAINKEYAERLKAGSITVAEYMRLSGDAYEKHAGAAKKAFEHTSEGLGKWVADTRAAYDAEVDKAQEAYLRLKQLQADNNGGHDAGIMTDLKAKVAQAQDYWNTIKAQAAQAQAEAGVTAREITTATLENIGKTLAGIELHGKEHLNSEVGAILQPIMKQLQGLREDGILTGDTIDSHLTKSFSKLSASNLKGVLQQIDHEMLLMDAAGLSVDETFQKIAGRGVDLTWIIRNGLSAALINLGVETEKFRSGMTMAGKDALEWFNLLASNAYASSEQITAAFDALISHLNNLKDVDNADAALKRAFNEGKISAQQLNTEMAKLEKRFIELAGATDPVEQAFKRLGIVSAKSLEAAAYEAKQDLDIIRESGKATTAELIAAFRVYAEKARAAASAHSNEQVKATEATLKTMEAALGLKDALAAAGAEGEEAGQKIVDGMSEAERAVDEARKATEKHKEELNRSFAVPIPNLESMSDDMLREIDKSFQLMGSGRNSYGNQLMSQTVERVKKALETVAFLRKQLEDKEMDSSLALSIESALASFGSALDQNAYTDLANALKSYRDQSNKRDTAAKPVTEPKQPLEAKPEEVEQAETEPPAREPAVRQETAPRPGSVLDGRSSEALGRMATLLSDIARDVAAIAKVATRNTSGVRASSSDLAGAMLSALTEASTRS